MAGEKRSLAVLTILLAFIAWGVFSPSITTGSVSPETADFGDVEVGSTGMIPLKIENTGLSTLLINLRWENNNSCDFLLFKHGTNELQPTSDNSLQPGKSLTVDIGWTPPEKSEGTTCSDTLKIQNGSTVLETVLVKGNAVPAGSKEDPSGIIVIGGCDTGVLDQLYDEKLISEWIGECGFETKNHGRFVRCVAHLTNELKKAGIITCQEKSAIQRCAAQAKLHHRPRSKVPRYGLTQRRPHHGNWIEWKNHFPHKDRPGNRP
jgi:hypothetical protein